MTGDDVARVLYLGLLLAAVAGWVFIEFRGRMGQALRTGLAWGMIVLGLMAGYGLWNDIRRDILPRQMVSSDRVVIPRGPDGHYRPVLEIGGQKISFIADTGASSVVLSPADARKLGIDLERLAFVGQAATANGVVSSATVRLTDVNFGPFHDDEIYAQVNGAEMDGSLLGMSYLGQFSITMAGDEMVLSR